MQTGVMASDPREGQVYSLLLDAIDRGELGPGARLVETELAERFGVSRTPVREALKRLEGEGIARAEGRRLIVASLDHDQMGELYEVRGVVEGLAARLAARHATPEEIEVLEGMVADDRLRLGDPRALAQSNRRFHRQLHRASHNRYLLQLLQGMRRSLALLSATTLADRARQRQSLEEHAEIIAAIRGRDGDAADDAARRHISNAYRVRLEIDAAG